MVLLGCGFFFFHILDVGACLTERWRWARFEVGDVLRGEGDVDLGVPVESGVSP